MSVPIKKWKGTKARVEKLLTEYPNMRDDLVVLMFNIWAVDLQKKYNKGTHLISFNDFINAMINDSVTPPETIRRTWQKIQEQNPELRGKKYNERHKTANEVTKEIVNE